MAKRFKKVYIEISNVCNLQCSFCPEVERNKRFMDPPLFRSVAADIAPLTEEVCFHLMGEPLLHPHFESYVEFCAGLRLPINLTTNGLLLDERRTEILLRPALSQINFSLQSFESNFPGTDNTAYLDTILNFTERALRQRPDLYVNLRLWNDGAVGSQDSNARIFTKIRDRLKAEFNPAVDVRWKKSVKIRGRAYLHMDSRFEWPDPHRPIRSTRGFCHGLSSHIGILADGTVVPCCLDKEGVISLGHCAIQSVADIVKRPRAAAMREGFQKGILVEDLCQKCTFIARFDKRVRLPAGVAVSAGD